MAKEASKPVELKFGVDEDVLKYVIALDLT